MTYFLYELIPYWHKFLAVTTPRGVEEDQPGFVLSGILLMQFNHMLLKVVSAQSKVVDIMFTLSQRQLNQSYQ